MSAQYKICPHCGKEILAVAKKCKYCKQWIEEDSTTSTNVQPQNEPLVDTQTEENVEPKPVSTYHPPVNYDEYVNYEPEEETKNYTLWYIIGGIAFIGLIIYLFFFVDSGSVGTENNEADTTCVSANNLVVEIVDNSDRKTESTTNTVTERKDDENASVEPSPQTKIEKLLKDNGVSSYKLHRNGEIIEISINGNSNAVNGFIFEQDDVNFQGRYTILDDGRIRISTRNEYIGDHGVLIGRFSDDGKTLVIENYSDGQYDTPKRTLKKSTQSQTSIDLVGKWSNEYGNTFTVPRSTQGSSSTFRVTDLYIHRVTAADNGVGRMTSNNTAVLRFPNENNYDFEATVKIISPNKIQISYYPYDGAERTTDTFTRK